MKKRRILSLVLILAWGLWMQNGSGEYTPYVLVLCAALAAWCYLGNRENPVPKKVNVFAGLFSACVVLGNISRILWPWPTFLSLPLSRLWCLLLVSAGSFLAFRQILEALWVRSPKEIPAARENRAGAKVFFGAWVVLAAVYSLVLWLAFYPGIFSIDNVRQLREIMGLEPMTNANPYYHTRLIGLFVHLGMALFGDMTVGIGLYSQFSVLVMSACFAYGIYVLWQETGSLWACGLLGAFYLLSPMHFMYSFTMWKDVLFSGAVMTFGLSLLRQERGICRARPLVLFSAFAMCLTRVNGTANLALSLAGLALLYRKGGRKKLLPLAGTAAAGFVLVFPLLSWLGISQPDPVETISVPMQQISYVIAEGGPISEEDRALLEQIVDVDAVPEVYKNYISDPIKFLLWQKNRLDYYESHKLSYLGLYLRLGMKYPLEYLQAWSEQTKGYWEGGYEYDRWNVKIDSNPWDISVEPKLPRVQSAVKQYLSLWESSKVTKITLCLGFYFWLCLGCLFVGSAWGDRGICAACLPFLTVVGLLAIGTPVFAEFRYGYPLVCGVPVLLGICLCRLKEESRRKPG